MHSNRSPSLLASMTHQTGHWMTWEVDSTKDELT